MKILFRVSGGKAPKKQLGFGHAYRTIHLAQNFGNDSVFFLLEDYGGLKKLFSSYNFHKIYNVSKETSVDEDIKKTREIIKKEKIDVLIIDKFHPKIQYIKSLRKFVKVVVISDLRSIDFPADIVFNGFVGFKNGIKYNKFGTKCFLGPSYQILNSNFSKKKKTKKKYKLLVTFGGLDENKIINKFLQALENYDPKLSIKIILGPGTQKLKIQNKSFKSKITIIQETKNMFNEISTAEFGLCSGGITSYEFAALGIPFSIIPQVKHQVETAKEWEKLGIATNLGLVNKMTQTKIEQFLRSIKHFPSIHSKKSNVIDGFGGNRIKEIIHIK
jgi:spore coat polysaccharide biosynthesis predicted glycosyltransferase SpsG